VGKGPYLARCGAYSAVVVVDTTGAIYYYYDASGAIAGLWVSNSSPFCDSYEPSFTVPTESCKPLTTECL
jgi:hypothetical protein